MPAVFNNDHWMKIALDCAREAVDLGEVPVGAVLVKDNTLIAKAHNQPINRCDPSAHAEIEVMRKAGEILQNYRLPNSRLFVTLEPCVMCAGSMIHARIKQVIFGAYDQKTGVISNTDNRFSALFHSHNPQFLGGVLANECGELLTEFFKTKRRNRLP